MRSINPSLPLSRWGGVVKGEVTISNSTDRLSYPLIMYAGGSKYVRIRGAQHTIDGTQLCPITIENSSDGGTNWEQIAYIAPIEDLNYASSATVITVARGDVRYGTKTYIAKQINTAITGAINANY